MMMNMRNTGVVAMLAAATLCFTSPAFAVSKPAAAGLTEAYEEEPVPPGFKVTISQLEGPLYTTLEGKTLYIWPRAELRNGGTADMKGSASACDDVKITESAGLMSPYPPGLELPDLDTRPTCAQAWPPVLAADDAKAVGKWTLIRRHDKRLQWARALHLGDGQAAGGRPRWNQGECQGRTWRRRLSRPPHSDWAAYGRAGPVHRRAGQ